VEVNARRMVYRGRMGGRSPCDTARRQQHVRCCGCVRLSEFGQVFVCVRFVL